MLHRWRWMTFLRWRYPAELIQSRLPRRLTVETWDGSAWVGPLPFLMDEVRVPKLPPLPYLSRFPRDERAYLAVAIRRTGRSPAGAEPQLTCARR